MKREQKYPDTKTFHFYNANPKKKYTGDCVYRAVATALGISWEEAVTGLTEQALKTGYSPTSKECMDKFLEAHGFTKCKQPRKANNTKYTGKEFCKELDGMAMSWDAVVANLGGNHVACFKRMDNRADGSKFKVWDTWNSTDGCVGNYWMKEFKW